MEYSDGGSTSNVLDFIRVVFSNTVLSGNRYAIFRMGYLNYGNARVLNDDSPTLDAPRIAPTPSSQFTLTPISTHNTEGESVLGLPGTESAHKTAVAVQDVTSTVMAFVDDCAQEDWIGNYATQNAEWEATKAAAESQFLTQIAADIEVFEEQVDSLPTPTGPNMVYEGLGQATVVFQNECIDYSRCILIVFDDLTDWRVDEEGNLVRPSNIEINLSGIEIFSILLSCLDDYQPECVEVQDKWRSEFEYFGAAPGQIEFHNGEALEAILNEYLRR
ncbi:MAG: hypothetical protein FVQ83_10440 [Chloroflexi bacterium]|nr:hypothetical protein [Chloroflexota bacterium]